jgi:hypothetical protein
MELPTLSDAPPLPDEIVRERVYRAISSEIKKLTGGKPVQRLSKELGRDVLEAVTEIVFAVALREGYFRFPNGYGSLKVQRLKRDPQPKRLPTGEIVDMPPNRVKLRYEEGAAVRESLGQPPKTSYRRRYDRRSKLSNQSRDLLDGTV